MTDELRPRLNAQRDLWLLTALFLMARVMVAFWFTPVYSEFRAFFFGFAALSDVDAYPFLDYWLEYPPIVPWVSVGVYKLVTLATGPLSAGAGPELITSVQGWYGIAMQMLMAVFDAGNLVLVYLIVREKRGAPLAVRAAWMYALLFYPMLVAGSYFDGFVLFWLLLAIWLFLREHEFGSAAALAVGVLAKVIPVIFLPVALKYLKGWHRRAGYGIVFTAVVAAGLAPFLMMRPAVLGRGLQAMAMRRPWETVWALTEGYHGYGVVGPEVGRTTPGQRARWRSKAGPRVAGLVASMEDAYRRRGQDVQSSRILSRFSSDLSFIETSRYKTLYAVMAVPFLLLLAVLLWKGRGERAVENVLTFSLAALCIFLLYSKGWSPQFVVYPMALCLLALGPYAGPLSAMLLGAVTYVEMPLWLIWPSLFGGRGGDLLLTFAVSARTVVLLYILVRCALRLGRRARVPAGPSGA